MNSCLNTYKNKIIHLQPGEEFCWKCDGLGEIETTRFDNKIRKLQCSVCLGKGKLDWVEKVTGNNSKYLSYK